MKPLGPPAIGATARPRQQLDHFQGAPKKVAAPAEAYRLPACCMQALKISSPTQGTLFAATKATIGPGPGQVSVRWDDVGALPTALFTVIQSHYEAHRNANGSDPNKFWSVMFGRMHKQLNAARAGDSFQAAR